MRVLQIIETAYRATLEEQDDTVVWITHAMKGAGGELDVLLRGNAVNYALQGQDASGLSFGAWEQTQPPRIPDDIAGLVGKGVQVYLVREDLVARGLAESPTVAGVKPLAESEVPRLLSEYDQAWHW